MEQIIIRKAALSDLDILLQFEQGVVEAERPFNPVLKESGVHYYNINELITADHIELLVALSGTEVIGCGYARIESAKPFLKYERYAYLGFMYVVPEHRGRGVNKAILQELTAWSKAKGITELRLDVYSENIIAVNAYEKAGFKKLHIQMRSEI
ncbi:GNAT family N-acetyltransferase [Pedobacter cryoconitis]|uniref:Ribosomal protein S18 acetylase RimI-like enzyme n=1 Tax=Pedobacter cryoconitis TaxID=188932 RepID=A0A327S8W2_9SPHI|nr:GNAT family N-acetyltransferase [Pedobacter cryoconitis]RAJ25371.1 ribosomal protein S18 acetylase RimI-like enzyme [Pedobacter cryoconitis]